MTEKSQSEEGHIDLDYEDLEHMSRRDLMELLDSYHGLIHRIEEFRQDIAEIVICLNNSQDPGWFLDKYNEMAENMWKQGKTWFGRPKVIDDEVKHLNETIKQLLGAIHWDAFAEDDTTLEIGREVAERIKKTQKED